MHNKRICFNLKRLRAIPPKKYIVTSVVFVCFVASVLISLFQSPYTKEEVYEKKVLINHIHFSQIQSKGLSVSDVQIILYGDDANYYAYIDYKIFDYLNGAAKEVGINKETLRKYCKNHNGWMYLDEYELLQTGT